MSDHQKKESDYDPELSLFSQVAVDTDRRGTTALDLKVAELPSTDAASGSGVDELLVRLNAGPVPPFLAE